MLAPGLSHPYGFDVDAANIYFTDLGNGTMHRVPKTGGPVVTLATGLKKPFRLTTDNDYVYFTKLEGGIIRKVAKLVSGR